MAIYNEILTGRFSRGLQKFFSMKGGVPAKQLSGEIMAVLPLFWGVENRYLEGWQRYAIPAVIAAGGAGNFSKVRLRNPQKSALVVVEKIVVGNPTAAATITVAIAGAITTDLANVATMSNTQLDLRGQNAPVCILSSETTAGSLTGTGVFQQPVNVNAFADVILFEDQELTLTAGNIGGPALHISNGTANSQLNVSIVWRERLLEDSEVT